MIIIDISIFMDILYMKLALMVIATILLVGGASFASAAQLTWDARTLDASFEPRFTYQRTITIDYSDGGVIADELRGKEASMQFSLDMTSGEIQSLIEHLNKQLEQSGSSARISGMKLDYSAELVGYDSSASIEYDIVMIPTIEKFLIQEYSDSAPAIFDVSWRGITTSESMLIDGYDITKPISLLKEKSPQVYEKIVGTDAELLLSQGLIDASEIQKLRIAEWHSLFDPTAIIAGAQPYGFQGDVVTTFSMGTSDIFRRSHEKIQQVELELDAKYLISTFEAADSAVLFVPGYASAGTLGDYEIVQARSKLSAGITPPPQEQFPIHVVYGMAGIAALGACGFFWWSGKRAKKEHSLGQTGIDPVQLRGVETSSASGGYHTNRGEAQLIGESEHPQTKSVYEKPSGTMPKGWSR